MNNLKNISLKQYIESNGITISQNAHTIKKSEITEELVVEQLHIISKFHKLFKGYNGYDVKNMDNKTGKLVEKYKMEIRISKKYIKNIEEDYISDELKDMILNYIERSEKCILQASKNYVGLIKRSMKEREICLGECYFNNIYENNGIVITNLNSICFDMVEIDAINFISKIKTTKNKFDLDKLIHEYVCVEKLDVYSEEFMKALISYPAEFMKWFRRYIKDEDKFSKDYCIRKMKKEAKKNGKSII